MLEEKPPKHLPCGVRSFDVGAVIDDERPDDPSMPQLSCQDDENIGDRSSQALGDKIEGVVQPDHGHTGGCIL